MTFENIIRKILGKPMKKYCKFTNIECEYSKKGSICPECILDRRYGAIYEFKELRKKYKNIK